MVTAVSFGRRSPSSLLVPILPWRSEELSPPSQNPHPHAPSELSSGWCRPWGRWGSLNSHSSLCWVQNCLPAWKRSSISQALAFSSPCLLLSSLANVFLKTSGGSLWTPILCLSEVSMAVTKHHYRSVLDLGTQKEHDSQWCSWNLICKRCYLSPSWSYVLLETICMAIFPLLCCVPHLAPGAHSTSPCTKLSWQSWFRNETQQQYNTFQIAAYQWHSKK